MAASAPLQTLSLAHAEAARSGWDAARPPATGWVRAPVPDVWTDRWPGFDGVVWYRVTWSQPAAGRPVALMLDSVNMAGAVYLNGALIGRDDSLVEPLSRAWNIPRYWVLDAPLLRAGPNTLLVRVSGLAAYQPGLGKLVVGDVRAVHDRYEASRWLRSDAQLLSLTATGAIACVFLFLGLIRPQEEAYRWFTGMAISWCLYQFNQIATTPWPFPNNDAWEGAILALYLVHIACFVMFAIRFCERRFPRLEAVMWGLVGCGGVALAVSPHADMGIVRAVLAVAAAPAYIVTCAAFSLFAARSRRVDYQVLAVGFTIFGCAAVYDMGQFLGLIPTTVYYSALFYQPLMFAMAIVLASRFVGAIRRIDQFNQELSVKVEQARDDLGQALGRQYALELAHARLAERIHLAHDLHDGLGGALVGNIAALEQESAPVEPGRFLAILKSLRDDLRLIIDSSSAQAAETQSLADLLAPLRHRMMTLFEGQGIDCTWTAAGLERCDLPTPIRLDVLRIVQEGLTNVLKHSRASRVEVSLEGGPHGIALSVSDNGVGLPSAEPRSGVGLRSLRQRAERHGGVFSIRSEGGRTVLSVRIEAAAAA